METIRAQHFGDVHWGGHIGDAAFEVYCVAHGSDYAPKYLNGGICHDGMDEGYCHPDCRVCTVPCPIEPCPLIEEADNAG